MDQSTTFRGHRENLLDESNMGNFLAIVKEICNYSPELTNHLENPARSDVTYLRPKSQNELIDVIGKKMIQARLVKEIKNSGIHAISADEVTSSNDEILSICMRFVDEQQDIREVFMDFVELERITGEYILVSVCSSSMKRQTSTRMSWQCYDGAPNTQSQKKELPVSF